MADTVEEAAAKDDWDDLLEHHRQEQAAAGGKGEIVNQEGDFEAVTKSWPILHELLTAENDSKVGDDGCCCGLCR